MQPDGTYTRLKPQDKEENFDVQDWLMNRSFNKKA
jgi:hypothetical protein